MDLDFILTERLAVGGGVWTLEAMAELSRRGFTHIIDVQSEFDDTALAAEVGIEVLWNPIEDDFAPKPDEFFERVAVYAAQVLAHPTAQLYVHCAAGYHRGPLAAAAVLCELGLEPAEAMTLILARRAGAEFPPPYRHSLERWVVQRQHAAKL